MRPITNSGYNSSRPSALQIPPGPEFKYSRVFIKIIVDYLMKWDVVGSQIALTGDGGRPRTGGEYYNFNEAAHSANDVGDGFNRFIVLGGAAAAVEQSIIYIDNDDGVSTDFVGADFIGSRTCSCSQYLRYDLRWGNGPHRC